MLKHQRQISPDIENNIRPVGKEYYDGQNPGDRAFCAGQVNSYTAAKNDPKSCGRQRGLTLARITIYKN